MGVSETGFCAHPQVIPPLLGPVEEASLEDRDRNVVFK
jgi:uncharacterized membrane protein